MTEILFLLIQVSIGALVLAIGMGATFDDGLYLWRRPALLARSLLAMYVAMPLVAFALAKFLSLGPGVNAALLVLAVSAGAPLLPRRLESFGAGKFVFSLVAITSVLAIVVVPACVALMARHFEVAAEISAFEVAKAMTAAFLLPLAAGILFRALAPSLAERIAPRAAAICGAALMAALAVLLVMHWDLLLAVGVHGLAARALLLAAALAIGHVLGGPLPENRTALAVACATRHIGIAAVVATTLRGPGTMVVLVAYVIAALLVTIPYLYWRRRTLPLPTALSGHT